ncbi:Phospholipase A1 VesT1.02 [Gryllus bimaculatus]|nr:Phospholipase A1 VesT1.02 [Gryllus bimaculatus]
MEDGEGKLHLIDAVEYDEPLPRWDGAKEVTLKLYTQSNPSSAQNIVVGDDSSARNFNPNNPTRFVIHGWVSSATTLRDIRRAYINSGKQYNVVMVDWSGTAASLYNIAKARTVSVGEYLAKAIKYLQSSRGLNLNDVYIIGHSLGAHIAGIAGDRLGNAAAQVVGMDPALPLFLTTSKSDKLDPSDAKFVQVIHTNGGGLGYLTSLGTADFFPNGGTTQPGCALDLTGTCSHNRSYALYAESVTSSRFVSKRCSSYTSYTLGLCNLRESQNMGEPASHSSSGDYYLSTRALSPYAQG